MLRIEIKDDNCGDDEAWVHVVPTDTSKPAIMMAIETLYPKATSVVIEVIEEP